MAQDPKKKKTYVTTDGNGHLVEYEDFPGRIEPPTPPSDTEEVMADEQRRREMMKKGKK